LGIELSEGVGRGLNVYDVIVGLRTLPIVEELPVATGGSSEVADDAGSEVNEDPRDVDEGSVDKADNTTLLAGGSMADQGKLELWASTVPRRVNKEHSVEK
jgi:hypothetical protein